MAFQKHDPHGQGRSTQKGTSSTSVLILRLVWIAPPKKEETKPYSYPPKKVDRLHVLGTPGTHQSNPTGTTRLSNLAMAGATCYPAVSVDTFTTRVQTGRSSQSGALFSDYSSLKESFFAEQVARSFPGLNEAPRLGNTCLVFGTWSSSRGSSSMMISVSLGQ